MKTEHTFTVTVASDFPRQETQDLLEMLIASGRADAQETCDDPDMSDEAHEDANNALCLVISIEPSRS
jgi:hypothetical protein